MSPNRALRLLVASSALLGCGPPEVDGPRLKSGNESGNGCRIPQRLGALTRAESPVSTDALLERLGETIGPFLIAEGQYSPDPDKTVRVFILRGVEQVAEAWIRTEDRPVLRERLALRGGARLAECDAMYATSMSRVWTTDGAPFEFWNDVGKRAWQVEGTLHLREGTAIDIPVKLDEALQAPAKRTPVVPNLRGHLQ